MVKYSKMSEDNLCSLCKKPLVVSFHKKLVVVISLIILVIVVFCMCFQSKKNATEIVGYDSESYIYIKKSLNTSVDPCVDFYEFSCGLWPTSNSIPLDEAKVTTFSKLQNFINAKIRTVIESTRTSSFFPRIVNDAIQFYKKCINLNNDNDDGLNLVHSYLLKMGGWPILEGKFWNESSFDWAQASVYLMKTLNIHPVLSISTTIDDSNSTHNIIYLRKPTVLLDESKFLKNFPVFDMLFVILETLNTLPNFDFKAAVDEMSQMSETEKKWKNMVTYSSVSHSPIRMSMKQLKENISNFDLFHHLQLIMRDSLKDLNQELSAEDEILIEDLSYIKNAISVLSSNTFSKRELADLFGWFVLQDIYILIPGVFEKYSFKNSFSVQEEADATKNMCFDHVMDIYDCSMEYLFVRNSSHVGIEESLTLIGSVKASFQKMIETSNWLESATKQAALLKLDNLHDIAGFQNYLNNKTKFDFVYHHFPLASHSLITTYMKIKAYFLSMMVYDLKGPKDKDNRVLPRTVTDVSAYYIAQKNTFVFPISMYHSPFYYTGDLWALNFGAIGSIIGHELMHGFDSKGYRRGRDGSLENWWSNSSLKIYNEHTQCFKEQHVSHKYLKINQEGRLRTLDENIADSEGLKMAYLAYKLRNKEHGIKKHNLFFQKYTPEQMFFIAFGSIWCSKISTSSREVLSKDNHNYPELRVNGAISNSKFFAQAFQCPKGSPMNPQKKCSMW